MYLGDVTVFSENLNKHRPRLQKVPKLLKDVVTTLKLEKRSLFAEDDQLDHSSNPSEADYNM